jgi:transcriptional regulator with XRE-family HTH domain
MKLLIPSDWLQRKLASDPDAEVEAGVPLNASKESVALLEKLSADKSEGRTSEIGERNVLQLRVALGTLVRQLRLRDHLSIGELAFKAEVSEEELRQVEHNPTYTARPRLLHQLSLFFDVSLAHLNQMAGATIAVDRSLYNDAVRYAAKSDDLSELTDIELQTLNEFVAALNRRGKVSNG